MGYETLRWKTISRSAASTAVLTKDEPEDPDDLKFQQMLAKWEEEDRISRQMQEEIDRLSVECDVERRLLMDEIRRGRDELQRQLASLSYTPATPTQRDDSETWFRASYSPDEGFKSDELRIPKFKGVEFRAGPHGFRFQFRFGH